MFMIASVALFFNSVYQSCQGGERRNVPHPEIGRIVVENWCYFRELYTFGEEVEIQEIFSKN